METLREMRGRENAFGFPLTDEIVPDDELAGRQTILDAINERMPGARVRHTQGTGISEGSDEDIAAAVELARSSDVAILVLGERSGLTDDATTGEFRDRLDLGLIGRQQELLEAVVATGTPVVLVVVSGRPLALEWAARHCAAILLGVGPRRGRAGGHRGRHHGRGQPGWKVAGVGASPRRPGAVVLSAPPDRWSLEPKG